jgi:CzcA family heavy metal efflux pump
MRAALAWILRQPFLMGLALVVLAFLGIYGALRMPVDLFPDLNVPLVNVVTQVPGSAPQDVELLVTRPLENQLRGVQGVARVSSSSFVGLSVVTVQFDWSVSLLQAQQLVTSAIAQTAGLLPPGATPRVALLGTALQEVVRYVAVGGTDPVTLRRTIQYDLASRLMGLPGVSFVEVLGGEERAFVIHVRPEALAALNLTLQDLLSVLRANNVTEEGGYLERSSKEYLIRGHARLETAGDLRSLPLKATGGETVLLGSVAQVEDGRVPRHYVVEGSGLPGVAFSVLKQPGADTLAVARGVESSLRGLKDLLPRGTVLQKVYDQSEMLGRARGEILHDLLLGALLAALVLVFFMGSLRPALVVAATLPLTLLATLGCMAAFHQSFNMITMSALALGAGMFVDDAIVVAENVDRHRRMGKGAMEATLDGACEISGPDASGSFTVVAAFLPLLLVTGIAGVFLRPFGFTMSAGLLVSLVISLTFVPLAFSRLEAGQGGTAGWGTNVLERLGALHQRALAWAFDHRERVLLGAGLSLPLMVASLMEIHGASLLPPIDEGAILIEYRMPHGTALSEMRRVGELFTRKALREPNVNAVYLRIGAPSGSLVMDPVDRGELLIKLRTKGRTRTVDGIMAGLRRSFSPLGGAVVLYHQPTQEAMDESFSGLPALFGVTIYGPDLEELKTLAERVEKILEKDPAIGGVVNPTLYGAPEVTVRLKYPELGLYGVSAAEVLDTVRASRLGVEATEIVSQREVIRVLVHLAPLPGTDEASLRALAQLPVQSTKSGTIPLSKVADLRVDHTPATLTRLNGQREVTLIADLKGAGPGLLARLRRELGAVPLPEGYSIGLAGQYKVLAKTAGEVGLVILMAVVLIYLVMLVQFRSPAEPFVILMNVPAALFGGLLALVAARQDLDVSVAMGMLTLVGISVNNGIVLLEYAGRSARSGMGRREALLHAASVRLRPVLLTAFTTLFALLPAAVTLPLGSRIFQPFALTVLGGLVSCTLSTLLLVPVLAERFGRIEERRREE